MTLVRRSEPYKNRNWQWIRFKLFVLTLLKRIPLLGILVIRIWRASKWLLLRCKWKLKNIVKIHRYELDINKTYWVSPIKIKYSSLREFSIYKYKGEIIGGSWDCLKKKFEDLDIYIALKEVCINGRSWGETVFYQRLLSRIKKGEILWGCKNKIDLDNRCRDLELLYQRIKNEGYKSQNQLSVSGGNRNPIKAEDEIMVSFGRYGDLLFSNSAHRLAIAKLLSIEKVPIKIVVRHSQWLNFRKEILLYAKEHGGRVYQPITHPDLNDIPAFHESEDRFRMIKDNLCNSKGSLLDIGANWGYFCHKFEGYGFDCYAVENYKANIYFLKKLKRAEDRKFKIITTSILEYQDIKHLKFNVVLALNMFHHFLKEKSLYFKFINLLKNLKMNEMFFEPHLPDEPQMQGAYKNYSAEEFVEFIINNSMLNNTKFIGKATNGRNIYKLY